MGGLFEHPLDNSRIVVAETVVLNQGREAVGLAGPLHFVQLYKFRVMVLDCTSIAGG